MALRVWLPLNGNLNNQGLDNFNISGTPTFVNGKTGQGLDLSKQITFTASSLTGLKAFSCCFWYKVNSSTTLTGNWMDLICFNTTDGSTTGTIRSETCYSDSYKNVVNGCWYGVRSVSLDNKAAKDTWYHMAFTTDGTTNKAYLNGVLQATNTTGSSYLNQYLTGYVRVGETNNINAIMNDLRIYDECLSPKQVKELSKGLIAHYKLDNFNGANLVTSLQAGGRTTIYGDTVQTAGTDEDTYFWLRTSTLTQGQNYTFKAVVSGMPDNVVYRWAINNDENVGKFDLKNGLNIISFTCPSLNDFTKLLIDDRSRPSGWNYPITFSKIELIDSNGGSVIDVGGNGYNGTISGTLTFDTDSPRHENAVIFKDGTDSIKTNLSIPDMPELSVAFWIKPNASNGGYSCVMSPYNSPTGAGLWIATNCEGTGLWAYRGAYAAGGSLLTNGTWYYAVYTFKNGTSKWYLNGVEQTLIKNNYTGTTMPLLNTTIGNSYTGTSWNTKNYSSISDFRIYATALSADDILTMYKNSGIIDNKNNVYAYEFKEE